jgi:hypothetical protein
MLQQHANGKLYQIHRLSNGVHIDVEVPTKPIDFTFRLTEGGHTWHATQSTLTALSCGRPDCKTCKPKVE